MLFAVICIFLTGGTKWSDRMTVIWLPVVDSISGNYNPIGPFVAWTIPKSAEWSVKKPPCFWTSSDVHNFQNGYGTLSSKRAVFLRADTEISHGSVAELLRCGGIKNDHYCKYTADSSNNILLIVPVKEFWKPITVKLTINAHGIY